MPATGSLIAFYRDRGNVAEPRRPVRSLTRHSTKVVPRAKLYDEAGVAITLTGLTVRYTLKHLPTGVLVANRVTASLENQTTNAGEAFYQLLPTHVANADTDFVEEWEVDHGGGLTETFPATGYRQHVVIVEDVDNV